MKMLRAAIASIACHEDVNFLLTNRIPRRLATRFFGWLSQIEQPLVRDLSIGVWRLFADLDLSEAREQRFRSLHDCFIRRLKDGVRPIDSTRTCWSARAMRLSAHPGLSRTVRSCRSRAFHIDCGTCSATRCMPDLPERMLCDAAAYLGHVSSLSCAT